jgi:NADPH2:quinone reductase
VIQYRRQDVAAEVRRLTSNALCDVVYDGVGKDTFDTSVACTRPRGLAVAFGNASGPVPPFDILKLSNGSKFVTRARLADYIATRDELVMRADELLGWIASGKLKLRIYKEYSLADAASAHRDLESGATIGKLILIP